MRKVIIVTGALALSVASVAHADAFRPGASPAGGRLGKICNSQFLSRTEQADCFEKMKAAKGDAERKEIRDVIRANEKERQAEVDRQNDNVNIGGANPQRGVQ